VIIMNKLYKFVGIQYVEAANEDEASERFANDSIHFAANAACYEVCQRCLAIDADCRCRPRPPIRIIVRKGMVAEVKNLNGADYEIIDHDVA
jgi:hypothetical protein